MYRLWLLMNGSLIPRATGYDPLQVKVNDSSKTKLNWDFKSLQKTPDAAGRGIMIQKKLLWLLVYYVERCSKLLSA